ncbi:MAG: CbiX/SirB N-terminal domain-containing protein [Halobacteriales archaeon]|nr:CbiX/SirB N-terminal domain-containing protein [Halobacteriales archaeon]
MSETGAGLVLVGHGSHLNPDSSTPVYEHADRIRSVGAFREVREAFWKEEPSPREVLRTLVSETVYVVPVFMSGGYFTREVLPRELRLEENESLDVEKTVHYTDPVGSHEAMTTVIHTRAATAVGEATALSEVGLAVIGHGTERNPDSAVSTRNHVERIRRSGRFAAVEPFFMDEDPAVETLYDVISMEAIAVVPLFVADGYHTREDIPALLGIDDAKPHNPDGSWAVDGRRVWYTGAVGTDPLVAAVTLERANDAGADVTAALNRLREFEGLGDG